MTGVAATLALAAIMDDPAGLGGITPAFEGSRRMDWVAAQALTRLMVVKINPLAVIDGEASMPRIAHDCNEAGEIFSCARRTVTILCRKSRMRQSDSGYGTQGKKRA